MNSEANLFINFILPHEIKHHVSQETENIMNRSLRINQNDIKNFLCHQFNIKTTHKNQLEFSDDLIYRFLELRKTYAERIISQNQDYENNKSQNSLVKEAKKVINQNIYNLGRNNTYLR